MTNDEEVGREIFAAAGYSHDAPPDGGAIALAVELYGGDCIIESPRAQTEAEIALYNGREWIVLAPRLPTNRAHFAVARMLARLAVRRAQATGIDEGAVAAFLVAPPTAFRARYHAVGLDLPQLSDAFAITQTCAAIRVAEVSSPDAIVITPERVYRPSASLAWVDDGTARGLAKAHAPRSLRKVVIRDEPGRVALYRAAS